MELLWHVRHWSWNQRGHDFCVHGDLRRLRRDNIQDRIPDQELICLTQAIYLAVGGVEGRASSRAVRINKGGRAVQCRNPAPSMKMPSVRSGARNMDVALDIRDNGLGARNRYGIVIAVASLNGLNFDGSSYRLILREDLIRERRLRPNALKQKNAKNQVPKFPPHGVIVPHPDEPTYVGEISTFHGSIQTAAGTRLKIWPPPR